MQQVATSIEPFPPPLPSGEAVRAMLVRRVDACGLSPGMVVGITEAGRRRIIAHGVADGTGRPVDGDTPFEIGSVTKLFTALLLADMALRGEAGLDEPVGTLLPAGVRIPSRNGQAITLRQLATHTSGLPRLPADIQDSSPDPYAGYTLDRLLAFLDGYELARTPGEGYEYSNLGAGLLGQALALRAGQDYEQLVAKRILNPLGMASTAIHLPPALEGRLASGHDEAGNAVPHWHFGALAGAGGLRSTASDLLLFLEMLMRTEDGPLGPASALLAAPREAGGLGFGLPQPEGHVALQHDGGTGGFRSYAGCIPAWRRGAVVLANAASGACTDLGIHLCDPRWALHWHRQPVPVPAACLDRLLGCYRVRPGVLFDVTRHGDRLLIQITGQLAYQVFPLSEWQFFYKGIGAQITFEPGTNGRAARLILHQNGRDQIAERRG